MNNLLQDQDNYSIYQDGRADAVASFERREMWMKTFLWMFGALLLSAASAYVAVYTPLINLVMKRSSFIICIVAELGLVIAISGAIHRLSARTAFTLFMIYSVLNGITLSAVLLLYTASSVFLTFMVTAGMFAAMAAIGATTKIDLSRMGSIFLMALVGIIIASLANLFLRSNPLDWIISFIGVILFAGLTAYDVQRYKQLYNTGALEGENANKVAVLAALSLYLDFINLFLMLLRFFGRRN